MDRYDRMEKKAAWRECTRAIQRIVVLWRIGNGKPVASLTASEAALVGLKMIGGAR